VPEQHGHVTSNSDFSFDMAAPFIIDLMSQFSRGANAPRYRFFAVLAAALWLTALPLAQTRPQQQTKPGQATPPPPGEVPKPVPTAIIRGRIVTHPDGKPIARARVILSRPDKTYAWVTITDAEGRYEITELEAFDNYMISASKSGYAPRVWGEKQLPEPPTPIKLADKQVLENIDVALVEQLYVAGKILDSDGTPFAGAVVSALRPVFVGDRREMVTVAEIITNDKGEYRLFGLPAGQYFISAVDPAFLSTGDHQGPLVYAATFYPGVASPEGATRLTLEPGQPRENIDFPLSIVKPARVSGKITSYDNAQLYSGAVVMSPYRSDRAASYTITRVDIKPDGNYEFFNVPPGRFIIRSRGEVDQEGIMLFGSFTLNIDGRSAAAVDMTLLPGARLEGLVEWEGRTPRPTQAALSEARIRAPMADGSMFGDALTGTISEDDRWVIRGAMAGSHMLRVENLPEPWSLKTVYFQGQDVTDIPLGFSTSQEVKSLRLIFTDRSTKLEGKILSSETDDYESYRVVAFPVNELYWRPASRHIKLARPDREGRFAIHGLPPSVYYLAAVRDIDESDLGDTNTLDRISGGATTVRLNEGERKLQDLRIRRAVTGTPGSPAARR
jgi:hypothetical protein